MNTKWKMQWSGKHQVLLAAVGLGLAGAAAAHYTLSRSLREIKAEQTATVAVVVARSELATGSAITVQTVSAREVPAAWAQSTAIRPDEFSSIENAHLKNPVGKGEMIMWSMIEKPGDQQISGVVSSGRRAITVPVDEISSLSGMLQPGDIIDLIASADKDDRTVNFPLLQHVRVLATGSRIRSTSPGGGDDNADRQFTNITLDTSPEEARRVIAARDSGRLTAILRNPGDNQAIGDYRLSMNDLMGGAARPAAMKTAVAVNRSVSAGTRIIYGDKL